MHGINFKTKKQCKALTLNLTPGKKNPVENLHENQVLSLIIDKYS